MIIMLFFVGIIPILSGLSLLVINKKTAVTYYLFLYLACLTLEHFSLSWLYMGDYISDESIMILFKVFRIGIFIALGSLILMIRYITVNMAKNNKLIQMLNKTLLHKYTIITVIVAGFSLYILSFTPLGVHEYKEITRYGVTMIEPVFGDYYHLTKIYFALYTIYAVLMVIIGVNVIIKEVKWLIVGFSTILIFLYYQFLFIQEPIRYLIPYAIAIILISILIQITLFKTIYRLNNKYIKLYNQQEEIAFIENLTYHLVHKSQNELSIIQGFSDILKLNKINKTNEEIEMINDINQSSKNLSDNFNAYINFFKLDIPMTFKRKDVTKLIQDILQNYNERFKRHNIELSYQKVKRAVVNISETHIEIIIRELLNNSITALENSYTKKIDIKVEEDNSHIIINIVDSGKGIPREKWDNIFLPTLNEEGNVNHLNSLALCNKIIFLHRGTINIIGSTNGFTHIQIKIPRNQYTMVYSKEKGVI